MFGRKKKVVVKKDRLSADDVIIGAAKTIGAAIGTASVAMDIGKKSANDVRKKDSSVRRKLTLLKKNGNGRKAREMLEPGAKQLADAGQSAQDKAKQAKKAAASKVQEAKKLAVAKAVTNKQKAEERTDELRDAAAQRIAPKKRRGLLGRIRG